MKKKELRKGDGWIGGVCAGFGEYFDIDPNLIRIAWALALCVGVGFFLYIFFWIFMPE
jgi:phage shock protein C